MSRRPWFPLYPDDYDADTAELTLEQDGLYSRMLRRAWSRSTDHCSLPADPTKLSRVLSLHPLTLKAAWAARVLSYWRIEGDRLVNARLMEEAIRVSNRSAIEQAKALKMHERRRAVAGAECPAESVVTPQAHTQAEESKSQKKKQRTDRIPDREIPQAFKDEQVRRWGLSDETVAVLAERLLLEFDARGYKNARSALMNWCRIESQRRFKSAEDRLERESRFRAAHARDPLPGPAPPVVALTNGWSMYGKERK